MDKKDKFFIWCSIVSSNGVMLGILKENIIIIFLFIIIEYVCLAFLLTDRK